MSQVATTDQPEVLTLTEAAELLRFSKAHLCHIMQGKVKDLPPLPHISVGRRKLFRRSALMDWLVAIERTR